MKKPIIEQQIVEGLESFANDLENENKQREAMIDKFTEPLKTVFKLASKIAREHRSEYICPEHILLGLISEAQNPNNGGVAAKLLRKAFEINLLKVQKRIKELLPTPLGPEPIGILPYNQQVQQIIENAYYESLAGPSIPRPHPIGTWHFFLALLKETEGIVADVLAEFGLDYKKLRQFRHWDEDFRPKNEDGLVPEYEYQICSHRETSVSEETFLSEQAKDGWELVSVVGDSNIMAEVRRFYFKRRV